VLFQRASPASPEPSGGSHLHRSNTRMRKGCGIRLYWDSNGDFRQLSRQSVQLCENLLFRQWVTFWMLLKYGPYTGPTTAVFIATLMGFSVPVNFVHIEICCSRRGKKQKFSWRWSPICNRSRSMEGEIHKIMLKMKTCVPPFRRSIRPNSFNFFVNERCSRTICHEAYETT